ncbi:hypothetical protein BD626DRAFT_512788 [Schizophyllum amplum]|uniref:Uncharacterized protein n=1 Tax=Schizophyllum amplum TaxID=97359 RepID=A0A550BZZ9_9AGAR|nr:hypothetical protein BD626DRAFT_512788 [Auriculariopsis ampla]
MVNTARLYVDLIFQQSGCFANWDPTNILRVGDYGTVRENDGELDVLGNVYDDAFSNKYGLRPPSPTTSPSTGEFVVSSDGVRQMDLSSDIQIKVPQIAECALKGKWEMGDGATALLLLPTTTRTSLPGACKRKLAEHVYDDMKDLVFVTDVYHSPAYALLVNHSQKRSITVAFQAGTSGSTSQAAQASEPVNPSAAAVLASSSLASAASSSIASIASAAASAVGSVVGVGTPGGDVSVNGQWIAVGHVDVLKTSTPFDFGKLKVSGTPGTATSSDPTPSAPSTQTRTSLFARPATQDDAQSDSSLSTGRGHPDASNASADPEDFATREGEDLATREAEDRALVARLHDALARPFGTSSFGSVAKEKEVDANGMARGDGGMATNGAAATGWPIRMAAALKGTSEASAPPTTTISASTAPATAATTSSSTASVPTSSTAPANPSPAAPASSSSSTGPSLADQTIAPSMAGQTPVPPASASPSVPPVASPSVPPVSASPSVPPASTPSSDVSSAPAPLAHPAIPPPQPAAAQPTQPLAQPAQPATPPQPAQPAQPTQPAAQPTQPSYVPLYKLQVLSKPFFSHGAPQLKDKTRVFVQRAGPGGFVQQTREGGFEQQMREDPFVQGTEGAGKDAEGADKDAEGTGEDAEGHGMTDATLPWGALDVDGEVVR